MNLYKKLKNIQRDARVALSMVTGGKTNGLDNYHVIDGRARITEGGATAKIKKGNFDVSLTPKGTDELSGLTQSFNSMTDSMRELIQNHCDLT